MEPIIRPITIWAISATFGFVNMFVVTLWHSVKVKDLETALSVQTALHTKQELYLLRLQKRNAESQARADQAELTSLRLKETISLLTETCSSECNQACWSQE